MTHTLIFNGTLIDGRGGEPLPTARVPTRQSEPRPVACLSEVRGQPAAKRALLIAAAGGHGLLLIGPPGAGKTMLARRLPGLLPPLEEQEQLVFLREHNCDCAQGYLFSKPVTASEFKLWLTENHKRTA